MYTVCLCCPCDKITAWKKVNVCWSHLFFQLLIWSHSLSCFLQLIALDGWLSSAFRLRSAFAKLVRMGWVELHRQAWMRLCQVECGRITQGGSWTSFWGTRGEKHPPLCSMGSPWARNECKHVAKGFTDARLVEPERKKTDAALLLLLFIATRQVGLGSKSWDIGQRWRRMLLTTSLGGHILQLISSI